MEGRQLDKARVYEQLYTTIRDTDNSDTRFQLSKLQSPKEVKQRRHQLKKVA